MIKIRKVWRAVRIAMRAGKILATSRALPRTLRALLVIGMVQVPCLPTDEIALVIALTWLGLRRHDARRQPGNRPGSNEDPHPERQQRKPAPRMAGLWRSSRHARCCARRLHR